MGVKKNVLIGKPGSKGYHFKYMKPEADSILKILILGIVKTGRKTNFLFLQILMLLDFFLKQPSKQWSPFPTSP